MFDSVPSNFGDPRNRNFARCHHVLETRKEWQGLWNETSFGWCDVSTGRVRHKRRIFTKKKQPPINPRQTRTKPNRRKPLCCSHSLSIQRKSDYQPCANEIYLDSLHCTGLPCQVISSVLRYFFRFVQNQSAYELWFVAT